MASPEASLPGRVSEPRRAGPLIAPCDEGNSQVGLGPTLKASFNLLTPLKALSPSTVLGNWVRVLTCDTRRHNPAHNHHPVLCPSPFSSETWLGSGHEACCGHAHVRRTADVAPRGKDSWALRDAVAVGEMFWDMCLSGKTKPPCVFSLGGTWSRRAGTVGPAMTGVVSHHLILQRKCEQSGNHPWLG